MLLEHYPHFSYSLYETSFQRSLTEACESVSAKNIFFAEQSATTVSKRLVFERFFKKTNSERDKLC